ncbi:MAG: acyl-CoA dehydrogenase family protein [Stappiaceae bacterium]
MTPDLEAKDVANQSPPYHSRNLFVEDRVLRSCLDGVVNGKTEQGLAATGAFWGASEAAELARLANTNPPRLKTHDPQGRRIDQVEFHPAYHAIMRRSVDAGLHCSVWEKNGAEKKNSAHQIRAARLFLTAQTECGHICPMTMTNASLAGLSKSSVLEKEWAPLIKSRKYDNRFLAPDKKLGVTLGMGMTEKQGGTDVKSAITRAEKSGDDDLWHISGHKWFFSAPMSDAFLILAQTKVGLSCFLTPRLLPDGSVNSVRLQRLKEKLGNRSNASAEVEFEQAAGHLVGEDGKGIQTIIEMVTLTRLDCALASAGLMRSALGQAVHHCRHRSVFGKKLVAQPIMARLLADMSLDVAAATALAMRVARAFDNRQDSDAEAAFARLVTPAAKYWICKSAPGLIYEAMECHGGNGYSEEFDVARLYREAPVNAIWEGSGNVMALDVLRVLEKHADALDLVIDEIKADLGASSVMAIDRLRKTAEACSSDPGLARQLCEELAIVVSAACLRHTAPREFADAFLESRLTGRWRSTYGMLEGKVDDSALVDFAYPSES